MRLRWDSSSGLLRVFVAAARVNSRAILAHSVPANDDGLSLPLGCVLCELIHAVSFAFALRSFFSRRFFTVFKPLVLVVVSDRREADLLPLTTWIRSHGCDVCACLASRFPPLRCWSDRFCCALLASPSVLTPAGGTVALRSPVDAWYLDSETSCPAQILPWLHASLKRGGVGVLMRRIGSARPRWGCYRQVRGCGLDLWKPQLRSWDGAQLAYPGRREPDLRARA
jgi:hypothetical protein